MIRKALWLSAATVIVAASPVPRGAGTCRQRLQLVGLYRRFDHRRLHQGNRHQGRLRRLRFQRDPRDQTACRRQRLRCRRADRQLPGAPDRGRRVSRSSTSRSCPISPTCGTSSPSASRNTTPATNTPINYMWGTVGIGYNVEEGQGGARHRQDRQLGRLLQAGKAGQARRIAASTCWTRRPTSSRPRLNYLGLDPDSTSPEDLAKAEEAAARRSGPTSASSTRRNTSTRSPMATSAWRSAGRATFPGARPRRRSRPGRRRRLRDPEGRRARCGSTRWQSRPMPSMSTKRTSS